MISRWERTAQPGSPVGFDSHRVMKMISTEVKSMEFGQLQISIPTWKRARSIYPQIDWIRWEFLLGGGCTSSGQHRSRGFVAAEDGRAGRSVFQNERKTSTKLCDKLKKAQDDKLFLVVALTATTDSLSKSYVILKEAATQTEFQHSTEREVGKKTRWYDRRMKTRWLSAVNCDVRSSLWRVASLLIWD